MKKILNNTIRKLLCSVLTIAMVLFNSIAVFAIEEAPEERSHDDSTVTQMDIQDEAEVQSPDDSTVTEMSTQEAPQAQPDASSETSEPEPSDQAPETEVAETAEAAPVQDQDAPTESASINTEYNAEDVSAETEIPEQPVGESNTAGENDTAVEAVSAPSEPVRSAAKTAAPPAEAKSTAKAATGPTGKTIRIGDTSFNSEGDESSNWSEGKGWKNIAGQYVAMVDYDGREAELSADEGVITLAVAGVNRIGALKGNCSYNIVGSGIVLIDSIEIEDGNGISLMPNTAIYDEGSAAVFLKQDDNNSYLLINGNVPGILDEAYTLDGVNLVVPEGSNLKLNAMCVRTETWIPDGSDEAVTDVTIYTTDMPFGSGYPTHKGGIVDIMDCGSRLVIGKNSTLTVESGASVNGNELKSQNGYVGAGITSVVGELIVQGILNVAGAVEGGYIEVQDNGSLSGTGSVKAAEVDLQPEGNLNVLLEDSDLIVHPRTDGKDRVVSLKVKDSTIYLRGTGIDISNLNVSGSSTLSIDAGETGNKVGNILLNSGSNLDITVNKYDIPWKPDNDEDLRNERDGLTDASLDMYGNIIGYPDSTISVLAGLVKYQGRGHTVTDVLPTAPAGYASRVLVHQLGTESTEYPLNMNTLEAGLRANYDQIPVEGLIVHDAWLEGEGMYRVWQVQGVMGSTTVSRSDAQQVTYPALLDIFGLRDENGYIWSSNNVAIELIYSDFSRRLLKAVDYYPSDFISDLIAEGEDLETLNWPPIPMDNVIMIRVLQYKATGGFGGASSSHTMSSVTGSGGIGNPGSGSMKTGKGAVIYGTMYVEPEPEEPTPEEPAPEEPTPEEPTPVDPTPEEPTPEEPTPEEHANVDPAPEVPANVDPAPGKTTPADPAPEKPDNGNNGENNDNNKSNIKIAKADSARTVSAVNDDGLLVSVSLMELTDEDAENYPDMPQIWQLSITDGGKPVTDLSGDPVKVTFPFTIPEDWGDPAEIDEDSLYAVFADDNELTAYKAEYDPETGEVSFETEQTGDFVIVQFKYEDEPFTEEFYKALAELKEIKDFLAVIEEERT